MISEMNWGHFYTKDLVQKRSTSLFSVAVVVTFHISDELFAQKTINGLLVRRNIFFFVVGLWQIYACINETLTLTIIAEPKERITQTTALVSSHWYQC